MAILISMEKEKNCDEEGGREQWRDTIRGIFRKEALWGDGEEKR